MPRNANVVGLSAKKYRRKSASAVVNFTLPTVGAASMRYRMPDTGPT